jgi:hypothetical protein
MAMKISAVIHELILYGGLPMTRGEVYKDALEVTGSREAADYFAFGPQTIVVKD